MAKKNGKQRLFEVMERVAPDFTGKALNEDSDFQQKINNGDVWLDHYGPSGSKEYTDGKIWYNRGGQQLRNPEEYNPHGDGFTPFGDEGDDLREQGPAPAQAGTPNTSTQQYGQQPDAQYADSTYKLIAPALKLINTPEKFAPAFKGWFEYLGYSPKLGNINIQRVRMDVENVLKQLGYK